jgi:large subunit ribosomal protein L25
LKPTYHRLRQQQCKIKIMAATNPYVKLAETLPPRLLRFFTRYQPQRPAPSSIIPSPGQSRPLEPSSLPNPFRSQKHPVTGRWQEPLYSLRRQADLVKLARAHGVEELLPPTNKGTQARIQKRAEHGLQVKGTGVGQRVKGKSWERTQKGRLNRRKQAMLQMPQMIHDWKQVSWTPDFSGCKKLICCFRRGMGGVGRSFPNDRFASASDTHEIFCVS